MCAAILWPIRTFSAMMIAHVSFTTIQLNALSSSYIILSLGILCHMLQQRISMMLRNVSTQRWNQVTVGGLHRYVSSISSQLRWFWSHQSRQWPFEATIVPLFCCSDQTHLTTYLCNKTEWLKCLNLGFIDSMSRSKLLNHGSILVSLVQVPSKHHIRGIRKTMAKRNNTMKCGRLSERASSILFALSTGLQLWMLFTWCGQPDAAMLSDHLYMDG